jgi:hypothetical protein
MTHGESPLGCGSLDGGMITTEWRSLGGGGNDE